MRPVNTVKKGRRVFEPLVVNNRVPDSSGIRQIRFRRNSALLGSVGRKALSQMVAMAPNTGDVEIRVRPFYRNRHASIRLAEARAKAIRRVLIDSGVVEDRIRVSLDRGTTAPMAEVEFHATPSQAIRAPAPIGMGIERDSVSAQPVEFSSPSMPKLSSSF